MLPEPECANERLPSVIDLTLSELDFGSVAPGAANESNSMPALHPHDCLLHVLDKCEEFPGQGAELIEVGLKSWIPTSRYLAVQVLKQWTREMWTENLTKTLNASIKCESNQKLREHME